MKTTMMYLLFLCLQSDEKCFLHFFFGNYLKLFHCVYQYFLNLLNTFINNSKNNNNDDNFIPFFFIAFSQDWLKINLNCVFLFPTI